MTLDKELQATLDKSSTKIQTESIDVEEQNIPENDSYTVSSGNLMTVFSPFTVDGNLTVDGELLATGGKIDGAGKIDGSGKITVI